MVASISDFVFRHNGNILHADEHGDAESGIFLMRVEFDPSQFDFPLADFAQHFSPIAEKFEMQWRLAQSSFRPKMAVLVSKYDHCFADLLYRHKSGELTCDIPLVISNHPDNQALADFYQIPFFVVPVGKDNKQQAEEKILGLLRQHHPDFLVLARYMQVLSESLWISTRAGSSISIIHSCRHLSAQSLTTRLSSVGLS